MPADVTYTIIKTPYGCWAIMITPTRTQKKFFRQTRYRNAKSKAEDWIQEQKSISKGSPRPRCSPI